MNAAKSFHRMTGEFYRRLIEINQFGAFYTAREGARHMRARAEAGDPGGSIDLLRKSLCTDRVVAMQHYNASKGAMAAMARGIGGGDGQVWHSLQHGLSRLHDQ